MDQSAMIAVLLAAQQPGASAHQRREAVQLSNQLKNGDAIAAASLSEQLVQSSQPLEAQVLGYSLLHHLVGSRWEDFPENSRSRFANLGYSLLQQASMDAATPFSIRSSVSLLLALILTRSGSDFFRSSLSQLIDQTFSSQDPKLKAMLCYLLKHIADEIVHVPSDSLRGDELRELLTALTDILPSIIGFIEKTIESSYAATIENNSSNNGTSAQDHKKAIEAALVAAEAYAEWAPISIYKDSGLVTAAGYLIGHETYRELACRVMLRLTGRKVTSDEEVQIWSSILQEVGEALMKISQNLLYPQGVDSVAAAAALDFEGENEDFGLIFCETMASLGMQHLRQAFPDSSRRIDYLHHMLAFAQHPFLLLADISLTFWVKLLQDGAVAYKSSAATNDGQEKHKYNEQISTTPPEAVIALMELAAEQLQQRNPHVPQQEDDIPIYFDTFEDYKEFMIAYRLKLSNIVKSAAVMLPIDALRSASIRLSNAVAAVSLYENQKDSQSATESLQKARVLIESAIAFLESTCRAVWEALLPQDKSAPGTSGSNELDIGQKCLPIIQAMEPMLNSLLELMTSDPLILQSQGKGIDAFGRLLSVRPDLAPRTLQVLFDLLSRRIPLETGGHLGPPLNPPPYWREGLVARNAIASVFHSLARAAPKAFLPNLEWTAQKVSELWDAQQLRPGERNGVYEALLAASLAGPEPLQISIANWTLEHIKKAWSEPEWQSRVSSPATFMAFYIPITSSNGETEIGSGRERWALYHEVHLLERAIRRMQGGGTPGISHPLTEHMKWAIPSLLHLCACLNAVFSKDGRIALGGAAAALELSPQEEAMYLKVGLATGRKSTLAVNSKGITTTNGHFSQETFHTEKGSGEYLTVGGGSIASLRAWLRHVREFCLQSLGMLPVNVPTALSLEGLAEQIAPAICSYVETMEDPHVRTILRHMLIPHIKAVPARFLEAWVIPTLAALLPHLHDRMVHSWQNLSNNTGDLAVGQAADGQSTIAKNEIIKERQIRELTQEFADALREIAARPLSEDSSGPKAASGAPLGAACAPTKQGKAPSGANNTLLELLLEKNAQAAFSAAQAAVEGMQLQDDAAYRFSMFCRALVPLASKNKEIYNYVGFSILKAAITSLGSEVMSKHQSDILGLIRAILTQQIGDPSSAVHGVFHSMPGYSAEREAELARVMLTKGSEKDQRNAIKKYLLEACGRGSFAALADWRPPDAGATAAALGGIRQRATKVSERMGNQTASFMHPLEKKAAAEAEEVLQGNITQALFS